MIKKSYLFSIVMLVLILFSNRSYAHVKWFSEINPKKESIENILSPLFIGTLISVSVLLAILTVYVPRLMEIGIAKRFEEKLSSYRKWSFYILKYGLGIVLISQIFNGTIFAPEIEVVSDIEKIIGYLAALLFLIPLVIATKIGAVILLGLIINSTNNIGLFHMLDYVFYLSLIVLFLVWKTKYNDIAFPVLYLGTGIALCWVSVEKWVYPTMSLDILANYNVPTFGFPPEAFLVLAAYIEFTVGYLLIVGILNRVLSVVVTILFVLTSMIFGSLEILGHSIVHLILITFIIEGVSFYKPPVEMHTTMVNKITFVSLNYIFAVSTFLLIYYKFA
ncbi:MAG: hypothetical protein K0S51_1032 [Bacillales bacterium]|jgi:hypothetical protein|nr:hypothetical protein [Bacillales bacterium]